MNDALTVIFAALCLALLVGGFGRRGAIYEFPFLAGAMAAVFILPQLPGLADDAFLPEDAFAKTILIAISCLAAAPLGWRLARRPLAIAAAPLDENRLLVAAALLSAVGGVFYLWVSRLPPETIVSVALTGLPVVLIFFSQLMIYGLAIALLCAARRPSFPALAIVLCDAALYLERVYITGKRGEAFAFLLMIAIAVWFQRRLAAPRMLVLTLLTIGVVGLTSTKDYRDITRRGESPGVEDLMRIDLAGNFKALLEDGGDEFRNAIMKVDHVSRNQSFDYGLYHWNEMVWSYVPAQLVGEGVKQALIVEIPGSYDRFFAPVYGTTETGVADAFASFGYLGAIKFFLIAYLLARIWRSAMGGDAGWQIVYMLSALPAMHVYSHHTQWIVTAWVHMAIFLGPALLWARAIPPPSKTRAFAR